MSKKSVTGGAPLFRNANIIDEIAGKVQTAGEHIQEIPLDRLRVRENVRKEYKNIPDLADSIKNKDLIEPVIVKPAGDNFFEIICGHRRYMAYCLLKEQNPGEYLKIKAIVMAENTTPEQIREIQIIENIQREDLSAMELKDALLLFREQGLSNGAIAEKLGKSEGFVHNAFSSIKMLEKNPQLEKLITTNAGVSFSDVQEVKSLPQEQQTALISAKASGAIKNKAELRSKVQQAKGCAADGPLFTEKNGVIKIRPLTFDPKADEPEVGKRLITALKLLIDQIELIQMKQEAKR